MSRRARLVVALACAVGLAIAAIALATNGSGPHRRSASSARSPSSSRLAEQAKALGDPTRLTIAVALAATDELCVCDLAWVTERAENLVSHHARTLRSLGLARSRREGKMVLYSLTDRGRAMLAAVLDSSEALA